MRTNVEVVGAEFLAKAVEVGAGRGGVARPSLGQHGNLVARNMLQRFGDVRMTAVRVGGVEEAQALLVSIQK